MNFIAFCEGLLDFFYIFAIYLDFFCISFQTLEKNSHGRNLGFVPKSSVNFQFLLQIDISRLITDLYQEKKVPGIFAYITVEF